MPDLADIPESDNVSFDSVEGVIDKYAQFNDIACKLEWLKCEDFLVEKRDGVQSNYSSISFPSNDYWKCKLYISWDQFILETTSPSGKYKLSNDNDFVAMRKSLYHKFVVARERKSLVYYEINDDIRFCETTQKIPNLNIKEISYKDITWFNMKRDKYSFNVYSNDIYHTEVMIQDNKLKIAGYKDQTFDVYEWLHVVSLINKIKQVKHETGGKFHWSTFWDLELDKIGPFDKDILTNRVLERYFPSIWKSPEFLNYINGSMLVFGKFDKW